MVAKWCLGYAPRVLLHAVNRRHGTDNFTSLPKEVVLRIFYRPLKIRRLRPGLNPRTWVLKASTLPLHHRSRYDWSYTCRPLQCGQKTLYLLRSQYMQNGGENLSFFPPASSAASATSRLLTSARGPRWFTQIEWERIHCNQPFVTVDCDVTFRGMEDLGL